MQVRVDYYKAQHEKMLDKLNKVEKRYKVTTKERDALKLKMIVMINNAKAMGKQSAEEVLKICKECN
jgi:hypothetical protein